jgi:guanosine-3',5'-bis(diphosphate) 3'-pyrophosphohydrolase
VFHAHASVDTNSGEVEDDKWLVKLKQAAGYLNEAQFRDVELALAVARKAHQGQKRLSGDEFISHPVEVACILAQLNADPATLKAALLHDVIEDTDLTLQDIAATFGKDVANLVEGVTKLERLSIPTEEAQAESVRKMLLAMAEDLRVVLIKLADRLHNMRTIDPLPRDRQLTLAKETLEIYAPLANRLGMAELKWELEDLSFRVLNPRKYREIVGMIARKRREREKYVEEMIHTLQSELKERGIEAEITGRPKHVYSIYQKMEKEGKEFSEIYDLIALRALVDTVQQCYEVLGIIHSLYKPIHGRFKDYIALPKSNGYQSLHTTVLSSRGEPIEIQIRTKAMHEVAERGIAAHWMYKEEIGEKKKSGGTLSWLKLLQEWRRDLSDAKSFLDAVKVDVFQDEVFVFTPKGDVIALPQGATPIDFAYRIHTEVGHRCTGAKVNGKIVPLDYHLATGDIVEIMVSKSAKGPSRDWLNIVRTTSAREKIRQWFKRERREENISKGKELFEKELHRMHGLNLSDISEDKLREVASAFAFASIEDFFAAIGYGDVGSRQAVMKLGLHALDKEIAPIPDVVAPTPTGGVLVKGEKGIYTTIARCCNPVPGDAIIGYTTRGKGVTVHRFDCVNVLNIKEPDRLVQVEWDASISKFYPVSITIEADDRTGLLRDIASVVAENKVNMNMAEVKVVDGKTAIITAVLAIGSLSQLSKVLEGIENVKSVRYVVRGVKS